MGCEGAAVVMKKLLLWVRAEPVADLAVLLECADGAAAPPPVTCRTSARITKPRQRAVATAFTGQAAVHLIDERQRR